MINNARCALSVLAAFLFILGGTTQAASNKVQVCHIPPDDPVNFHTITIGEKALTAHLAHGDLTGPCDDSGSILCDDGDACTIDALDPATGACLDDHPPVNCSDGLLCTIDSCDPSAGCQYAPIDCDDGDLCTVDECSEYDGQCTNTPIDCGTLGICLSEDGQCDYPCEGISCDPIDQCHEPGACVLPGECVDGVPVEDGTPCNDGNPETYDDQCTDGVCEGAITPSCASLVQGREDVISCGEGAVCSYDVSDNDGETCETFCDDIGLVCVAASEGDFGACVALEFIVCGDASNLGLGLYCECQ